MRNKNVKMSLEDIYNGVCESMESKKSELVSLLEDITEPSCPQSGEELQFLGKSGGENRALRFKGVCPKSVPVSKTGSRVCTCGTPCTDSTYGKCVYTYPDKTFRLYPCVAGNTEHWDRICKHRVPAKRTINLLKDTFALADNRSCSVVIF